MFKKLMIVLTLAFLGMNTSQACTVWGAITPDKLLIAKNRDFYPGQQEFRSTVTDKYHFFALYDAQKSQFNSPTDAIRMGINEKGLVAYITFATTLTILPPEQRAAKTPFYDVMKNILENYASVDAIANDSELLFPDSTPINYIFADRNKAMICEVGLNRQYHCKTYSRNSHGKTVTFAQTNHYIFSELAQYNLTPVVDQQTSYLRLKKINELMTEDLAKLTLKKFIHFSFNTTARNDNPLAKFDEGYNDTYQDNSIFRTFNSKPDRKRKEHPLSDQAVSAMIVELPKNSNQPIKLYLRIIDGITDSNDKQYTQTIKYREASTTLDAVINHPDTIDSLFTQKSCKRDLTSSQCE